MSTALIFTDKTLLQTPIVAADGAVVYTTSTTSGTRSRKDTTTIMATSGLVGAIDWREKSFVINGVQREWDALNSHNRILSSEREWNWESRVYKLKYHNAGKELVATPSFANAPGTVRFTPVRHHFFHQREPAAIYFPAQMHDEVERMFLLMVILQTETRREDTNKSLVFFDAVTSCSAISLMCP